MFKKGQNLNESVRWNFSGKLDKLVKKIDFEIISHDLINIELQKWCFLGAWKCQKLPTKSWTNETLIA